MNPNRCGHGAVDKSVGSGPGLLGYESSFAHSLCDISVHAACHTHGEVTSSSPSDS